MKKNLICMLMFFTGCATVFSGTTDQVGVHSEPSQGKVFINGTYMGTTPATLSLKRDKDIIS